jgi:hypothetical protein
MKGRQIASEVDLIGLRPQLRMAEPRSLFSWNLDRDIGGLDALDVGFGHVGPGLGE